MLRLSPCVLHLENAQTSTFFGTVKICRTFIMQGINIAEVKNSIQNKEELPEEWEVSIIVPIYKMGDKIDCNNYRGISLLPTTYKILSNILLLGLTP